MKTWADWGDQITLAILIFWGLFVMSSVMSAFMSKDQRRSISDFYHRMMDPHNHHHSQRG